VPPSLLPPHQMPTVAGLSSPAEFYVVTVKPALLAGMPFPTPATPWETYYQIGLKHVVRLEMEGAHYDPSPLKPLHAAALEDLVHTGPPQDPQAQERLVIDAVAAVLSRLEQGEGVIVHCVGGTGRTGTVLGCCLVGLGHPAPQVISYLDQLNQKRGKKGWPESAWQSELVARFSASQATQDNV
jgi:protein-tyrosine phosphatase